MHTGKLKTGHTPRSMLEENEHKDDKKRKHSLLLRDFDERVKHQNNGAPTLHRLGSGAKMQDADKSSAVQRTKVVFHLPKQTYLKGF